MKVGDTSRRRRSSHLASVRTHLNVGDCQYVGYGTLGEPLERPASGTVERRLLRAFSHPFECGLLSHLFEL